MAAKYDLGESMTALKEQIPEVMGTFGALREQVGKDGLPECNPLPDSAFRLPTPEFRYSPAPTIVYICGWRNYYF